MRLWSPAEQERRPPFTTPEILDTDPLPLALQLAAWGAGQGQDLRWLDPPPPGPLAQALGLLGQLGAVDTQGHLTPHGRSLLQVGLHPRLGHMLLLAEQKGWLPLAAALAALLSERDPLAGLQAGSDLLRRLDGLLSPGEAGPYRQLRRLQKDLEQQVARAVGRPQPQVAPSDPDGQISARLIAWAYPERIALSRGQGDGRFLLHNGRGAKVHPGDPLAAADALAIAAVDGGGQEARVNLAVRLERPVLDDLATPSLEVRQLARWDPGAERVRCEEERCFGALVLARAPWPGAPEALVRQAMATGLKEMGLEALPWTAEVINHLRNDSPSFHPVHSLIRAIGPRFLHHVKGRGPASKAPPAPFQREISPVWSAFSPCSARNHRNPAACRPSIQLCLAIRGLGACRTLSGVEPDTPPRSLAWIDGSHDESSPLRPLPLRP